MFWRKNKTAERLSQIEADIERIDQVITALVMILKRQNIVPKDYSEDSEDNIIVEEISNPENVVNEYVKEMYSARESLEARRIKRKDDRKYIA